MGFGDPPAGLKFEKFWDGSSGTPTDFPWGFESPLPFTPLDSYYYFSKIVVEGGDRVVYVIDRSAVNFWRYNLDTKRWTKLANPNYDAVSCERALVFNPSGTKIATLSDRRNVGYTNASRVSIYDIDKNEWWDSSQAPNVSGLGVSCLCSLCFNGDDEMWVWARDRGNFTGQCQKLVPSTDTWTAYANVTGVQTQWMAYNADYQDGVVFGGSIGAGFDRFFKYTIAGDTYAVGASHAGCYYCRHSLPDHLFYYRNSDKRIGYLKTSDETFHDDTFPLNTLAIAAYLLGVKEDLTAVISMARTTVPKNMSYIGTGLYKLVEKSLSGFNMVVFEKTEDGYAVIAIEPTLGYHIPVYNYDVIALPDGDWEFYYPKAGDYTKVDLYNAELE